MGAIGAGSVPAHDDAGGDTTTPDMTDQRGGIAQVIVDVAPFHLDHPFDYAVADTMDVRIGQRVQVTFAGRRVRGLVVGRSASSTLEPAKIRPIGRVLGDFVWMREADLATCRWAADRFGAPMADVIRHALPARTVDVERRAAAAGWFPPDDTVDDATATADPTTGRPAGPADVEASPAWAPYAEQGVELLGAIVEDRGSFMWRPLPDEDVAQRLVELAQIAVTAGRGVLVIVPDPASRVADTIVAAFGDSAVDLRSGISPRVRYQRWLRARCGRATVVVGERGAAFTPVQRLGLAVVVDEANPMLKELRSPRHHVREVVLERARRASGVGLVTGTVPSAVTWKLLRERRLRTVVASRSHERSHRPVVQIVDFAGQPRVRIAREGIRAIRSSTAAGRHAVVLAARAGIGRALVCAACGAKTSCQTCGSMLAPADRGWGRCDRCATSGQRLRCAACRADRFVPLAAGTRQLATEIARTVSADVTVMEGYDAPVPHTPSVLVMTRGSVVDHPPGDVGAVIVVDFDAMLRRPTLNAAEDALRLVMALARWTVSPLVDTDGGHARPGDDRSSVRPVIVQTREPDHHAVVALQRWDPGLFWRREAALRAPLRLPPASDVIRIEARGGDSRQVMAAAVELVPPADSVLGPMPTERGEVLLVTTEDRAATLAAFKPARATWSRQGLDVRLEVDPIEV